jgi:hypothetical protein
MSKYLPKFPRKNIEFNTHLKGAVQYLNDNSVRLRVDPDDLIELNDFYNNPTTGWIAIYPFTLKDGNGTTNFRKKRDILRGKIEALLLVILDIPKTILTVEDRSALRINLKKKGKTRSPKMESCPLMSIDRITHLGNRLRFKNPLTPDSFAMPYKQHIVLECFIGVAGIANKNIPWGNAQDVTRFLYSKSFTDADVSLTIYYRCCYENTRGERSIWSKVVKSAIS